MVQKTFANANWKWPLGIVFSSLGIMPLSGREGIHEACIRNYLSYLVSNHFGAEWHPETLLTEDLLLIQPRYPQQEELLFCTSVPMMVE